MALFAGVCILVVRRIILYRAKGKHYGTSTELTGGAAALKSPSLSNAQVLLRVMLWVIGTRLLVLCIWYAGMVLFADGGSAFFSDFLTNGRFLRWDAGNYQDIARYGYVVTKPSGEPSYTIVFLPLYSQLGGIVGMLLGGDVLAGCLIVSNTALIGCCFALYRLMTIEFDSNTAMRCVKYFVLMPLTYYFDNTYSESTFLLLTVLTMICARRRKWLWAGVFGALTTYSRMQGAVVAVFIMAEGVMSAMEDRQERKEGKRAYWKRTLFSAAGAGAMCALGLLMYLYMNWIVYGDAFKFLQLESEVWFQTASTPFATLSKDWRYLLTEEYDLPSKLGIWSGNLFFAWGALALGAVALRRVRPSYVLYLLIYVYIVLSPSWLLSGPRYITACAAAYPMLARVGDQKWRDGVITAILLGALAVYAVLYYVYSAVL